MARKSMNRREHDREHTNRFEESREFETREFEKRPVMNMLYQDPLYIDPKDIPEGYEYRWVRESCLDKPDTTRMVEMKRKGWTPVPANRHPDMVFDDFFGKLTHMRGYIYYSGLILCEREKHLGDEERKLYEKLNHEKMTSIPGTENFMGEPSMPGFNNSKTYLTKAASFVER